ncbi:ATP synthase subunit gamma, mitochondrial-like isoform X3 [Bolinopsis microptera]|uniref:ATP synthase subunit gamma, mitochondrial-like isoform X3 n=1 Tax=Bolinopsis microptera TaxID=2820187 RepID=UPI003079F99C
MATTWLRASMSMTPTSARGMATLKDIETRLKSVKNIKKITSSMKMVSAAKFTRAEKALKPARVYGTGAAALYDKNEFVAGEDKLYVAISSDRGLCGGIHSGLGRKFKALHLESPIKKSIIVGDKAKLILLKTMGDTYLSTFNNVGKKASSFTDALEIAEEILSHEFDSADIAYNSFINVVSYKPIIKPIPSAANIESNDAVYAYDEVDSEVVRCYQEFSLANIIHHALKEQESSEQSARMNAMENATRNAGEMIDKLQLQYNRTRQAVITRELIEIISGANALE